MERYSRQGKEAIMVEGVSHDRFGVYNPIKNQFLVDIIQKKGNNILPILN